MKAKKIFMFFVLFVAMTFVYSCTTGQYMTMSRNENAEVLGTINAEFSISGSFRYRNVINTQAYIHLLAEAQKAYQGNIDVRDISWAIGGGDSANNNHQYNATGKVIRK